jgi:tetratricopeptide (TPR) repeat protein
MHSLPPRWLERATYELYVRAGILAYLDQGYERALELFGAASPLKPEDAHGSADDLSHIGVSYLVKLATAKGSLLEKEALDEARTDVHRAAIELAELYFQGLRPDKTEKILRQVIGGNPHLGSVPGGLKAYAALELAAALDRQDDREEEAAQALRMLQQPEYKGTYWSGYGLFRQAIYAWNNTQDGNTALPLLQSMLETCPKHPKAEDALYYYILISSHLKKTNVVLQAGEDFLKKHPQSERRAHVEALLKDAQRKGTRT